VLQRACQSFELAGVHEEQLLAPLWHTRLLLLLLLAVPAAAITLHEGSVAPATSTASRMVVVYAPLLVTSAGLALYVARLGLPGWCYRELLGKEWLSPDRVAIDVALAALLTIALLGVETALISLAGIPQSLASHALVARTSVERWLWLPIATTIGVSEELVYRGYLQRQFTAISQSAGVGIVAQALLFGIAHGEQGGTAVIRFAAYGAAFGGLARSRKSLLPCVLSHVAIDSLAGLGA
jgi:CAAX protease family protein